MFFGSADNYKVTQTEVGLWSLEGVGGRLVEVWIRRRGYSREFFVHWNAVGLLLSAPRRAIASSVQ